MHSRSNFLLQYNVYTSISNAYRQKNYKPLKIYELDNFLNYTAVMQRKEAVLMRTIFFLSKYNTFLRLLCFHFCTFCGDYIILYRNNSFKSIFFSNYLIVRIKKEWMIHNYDCDSEFCVFKIYNWLIIIRIKVSFSSISLTGWI